MNFLMNPSANLMMSSKEISELTNKTHKNVIRDIRDMLNKLDGSNLSHEQYQEVKDSRGYASEILLGYDLTMLLVTGYNVNLRFAVIKRWKELETSQQPQQSSFIIPTTLSGALRLAAEQAEMIEHQKLVIENNKPIINAFDRIATAPDAYEISEAAKIIKIPPSILFDILSDMKWIYKCPGKTKWIAMQSAINSGYVTMSIKIDSQYDCDVVYSTVLVTTKGVTYLSKIITKLLEEIDNEEQQ